MEAGGTDGDGWEGHVGHWEGRLLQGGHHLDVANVTISIFLVSVSFKVVTTCSSLHWTQVL